MNTVLNDERRQSSEDFNLLGTPLRWYVRGTAAGMLFMASINAVSYFVRSRDWSSLIGKPQSNNESIGFPFKIWEAGNTYGGMFADYPMLGLNILIAFVVGSAVGIFTASRTRWLNNLLADSGEFVVEDTRTQPIQFSLLGMMILTTIVAIISAIASRFAVRPETMIAIYALGPISLVAIAMLPRRLTWQQRVMIITPLTFALIGVAIAVGLGLQMEFDKVLMGIFLCWVPQSAVAAIVLTSWILYEQASRGTHLHE